LITFLVAVVSNQRKTVEEMWEKTITITTTQLASALLLVVLVLESDEDDGSMMGSLGSR
jgi:hypothetical protein